MEPFHFQILLTLTAFIAVACFVVEELTRVRLPAPLLAFTISRKAELVAASERIPWLTPVSRLILVGYFSSLALMGFFVPYSQYLFLLFTIAWTALSAFNAPNIQSRAFSVLYEVALILNGIVIGISFFAPIASLFGK